MMLDQLEYFGDLLMTLKEDLQIKIRHHKLQVNLKETLLILKSLLKMPTTEIVLLHLNKRKLCGEIILDLLLDKITQHLIYLVRMI